MFQQLLTTKKITDFALYLKWKGGKTDLSSYHGISYCNFDARNRSSSYIS